MMMRIHGISRSSVMMSAHSSSTVTVGKQALRKTMFQTLLEPFTYEYMRNAIWVSSLVGGVCGFLSAYLMLKGWSLIGDALSHSIVPCVAGAYMIGLPFALGAFLSGGLAAGAMLFLNQRTRLKEDAIVGLIFTSF